MRHAGIVELLQNDLQRRHALRVGLADHDGHIAGRKRQGAFVRELDRAGAVDECEIVAEECCVRDVQVDAHRVVAGFRRIIADGRLRCDRAGPRNAAGAGENGFEKCRLAACEGSDQRNAARAADPYSTSLSAVSALWAI